jgi:hypothetical protein
MGRPPLPVGTFGNITAPEVAKGRFRARCRFRDYDGKVRYVVRYGPSKAAAERNLKGALVDREKSGGGADLSLTTKVIDLSAAWLLEVEASVRDDCANVCQPWRRATPSPRTHSARR